MSKKGETAFMGIGILAGLALSGTAVHAADYLTARPSSQTFYIDGQQTALTAYTIGGSNYVRLRDIGRAVDFGVIYDGATNSVYIDPDAPYVEEVPTPAQATLSPSALTEEAVRAAILALKETYPNGATYPHPTAPAPASAVRSATATTARAGPCSVRTPPLETCRGGSSPIPAGMRSGRAMCWITVADHPATPSWCWKRRTSTSR